MHPLLKPEFGLLMWTLVAFLVVFFILKKYAWPAITNGLKQREQGIADALSTAERVKAEMAQMKSEHEALLVQAREERAQMLKEARETKYWLRLLKEGELIDKKLAASFLKDCEEILKILTAILNSSKAVLDNS